MSRVLIVVPIPLAIEAVEKKDLLRQCDHGLVWFLVPVELLVQDACIFAWPGLSVVLLGLFGDVGVANEAFSAALCRAARTLKDAEFELRANLAVEVIRLDSKSRGDVVVLFGYFHAGGRYV